MGQGPYVFLVVQQRATIDMSQGKGFNKLKKYFPVAPLLFPFHNAQVFCAMSCVCVYKNKYILERDIPSETSLGSNMYCHLIHISDM